MPTYEFRCTNGHVFDQFHKISDAPSTATCPTCGAVAERAISGGAGLVFKGSGFYLTDYGKNAHRSSGTSKPAESKGEGSVSSGEGGSSSATSSTSSSSSDSGKSTSGGTSSAGGGSTGGSSGGASGSGSAKSDA